MTPSRKPRSNRVTFRQDGHTHNTRLTISVNGKSVGAIHKRQFAVGDTAYYWWANNGTIRANTAHLPNRTLHQCKTEATKLLKPLTPA